MRKSWLIVGIVAVAGITVGILIPRTQSNYQVSTGPANFTPTTMSSIFSDSFDSVTAPTLPSGWTFDSTYATYTSLYQTPNNSITTTTAASAFRLAYYDTIDSNSGNVDVSIDFSIDVLTDNQVAVVFARSTAKDASNQYQARVRGTGASIFKRVAGVSTQIGSTIGASAFEANRYYRLRLRCNGTTISGYVQRLWDQKWLDTSGNWVNTVQAYASGTDSAFSAAGYAGFGITQTSGETGRFVFDNFELNTNNTVLPGVVTQSTVSGSAITLTCTSPAGGTSAYTYQWYRSTTPGTAPGAGTLLSGATSLTLSDSTASIGTDYYYILVITDSLGDTARTVETLARRTPTANALKIGIVADSIAALTPSGGSQPPTTMATILAKNYGWKSVTISNQAISSTGTPEWAVGGSNLVAAKSAFAAAGVTHVMVCLGINDAATYANTKATYKTNLSAIANDLVSAGYTVVLNVPTYVRPKSGRISESRVSLLQQYGDAVKELANGTTILLGDTMGFQHFGQNWYTDMVDGVHPNATGAAVLGTLWADGFAAAVDSSMYPSTADVRLNTSFKRRERTGALAPYPVVK